MPALAAEQRRDPVIAVATIGAGQPYDGRGQSRLMVAIDTPIAVCVERGWPMTRHTRRSASAYRVQT